MTEVYLLLWFSYNGLQSATWETFLPEVFAEPSLDTVAGGLLMTGPCGMLVGNADSG